MALSGTDPYYETGPSGWLREFVTDAIGIEVAVRDDLTVAGINDRDAHTIWVRPGLEPVPFHWLIARSVISQLFGPEAAPDFRAAEGDRMGRVFSLQRRRA